ncbi:cadherin domain-containing protein [Vibrio fortis]|uniref:cadherin domain-containing protein n=1 Tax=Vibrio fortis TaxID=212667 RepID=UPI003EBF3517
MTATDGTDNSAEAFATIKFDGVNDAPVIDTATGSTQVENVAQEGDTVATFTASDLDNDDADVTYSITSGNENSYFTINEDTGVVTLTAAGEQALANDKLTDTDYVLGVTATDGTDNSAEAFATIKFDGVNDAPVIDTATGSTQVENVAQEGDTVATFTASDLDNDDADVTYSITSGNENSYFTINEDTGVVTLTAAGEQALANDKLTDTDYVLGVTATDGTDNSAEAFATIKFDGVNDAPVIDTATGSTQVENVAQEGDTVATFTASDLDNDDADVTYSITSGNENSYFTINEDTGVVTLTAAGEQALANDKLTDTDYVLGVTATDGTDNSAEAFATIKFDGVNDAPVIDTATGSTQVENVAQEGDTVATFTASDLDNDDADVTYSITSGNENSYFTINEDTGVVTLTAAGEQALANDKLTDTDYVLGVTATDGTDNSAEAFATIKFDGVNDAPVIDTATGSTQVENVAQEGDTVATFTASDLDNDDADVTYSITSGNENSYFTINEDTGVVTLTAAGEQALANDKLTDTDYVLGVTATDGTDNSAEAFATIKFDGVNDAPVIDTATGSTQVENVAQEGDTVATFTASDLDNDDADVTYSITSGNENSYFTINEDTGVVTLTAAGEQALANDKLTDTDYVLGVTATDGTDNSAEAFATIKFDGVNDAPVIDTATGSTQVENVAQEGDTVATFTASDLDNDDADVTYSITSGNENSYFTINEDTGVVTLTAAGEQALANDKLTDTDYVLGVTATDGTDNSAEAFATIKFDGVNDAPVIDTATGSTQVENVAQEGDTVATFTASDLDNDDADVTYSITSGNENSYFTINEDTGVVTLTAAGEQALANDKLTDTDYVLGVTATDGTDNSAEAFATIKFDGVNDAPVIDTATGSTQVENVAQEGDTVATFTASDLDNDDADVTYSITSGNENSYFTINEDTGVVTLTAAGEQALANDKLTDTDYVLGVTATDGTDNSAEAFATIKFDGVNDAPVIDTATGSTQVENVAQEGDTVATFTASDLDNDDADVTYSITSGNENSYFTINEDTGVVTLTAAGEQALANDKLTDTDYVLGVTATDGTDNSAEAFATIKFDGVNDAPVIDTATGSTQVENVAQEGDTVATFTASDLDNDDADVTYSITSGNENSYFTINEDTGVVTLTAAGEQALANDKLTDTDYVLGVTATDGTDNSAEAFATIKFDGVNDAPVIDTATGSTQVENVAQEGDTVATFTASDLDNDDADVTYSITSGNENSYFTINEDTGVVTLTAAGEQALANDKLTDTDYVLGVTATDGTDNSAEAFATIKFDGVNDAPVIDTATGSTQVENVAQEGDTVATFTASDLDNDDADVTYSITSGNENSYFTINEDTGVVTLTAAGEQALANDKLTDTDYVLGVTATDGTDNSAEAFATIKFDGVNDAPVIDTATGSTQVENVAQEGDTVATFTASDLDNDDADVTYSITSGNENSYFTINEDTGVVTLTAAGEQALANDKLTDTDYVLGVTATDGTDNSAEAFATIKFDGVNDAPVIDTATGSTQVENVAQEGDTVATFTASDLDNDDADVTYSITSGNENSYFTINEDTGVVTLTAAGEQALANDKLTDTDYVLGVTATDGTDNSAEAFATIKFDGVNDAPVIDTATGSTQVENVAQEGDTVATFTASDLDNDDADVTYSITSGNENSYFTINEDTGVVTLTAAGEQALANDKLTDTDYVLGVTATDGTDNSAEAFATIKFDGVNDKPTATDFSVTLDNQDEAFFTFDGGQSGSQDNVGDIEDDASGTAVGVKILEEPLFGNLYDVSGGGKVLIKAGDIISSDAQIEYEQDQNAVDSLDFVASTFQSQVGNGTSSVSYLQSSVVISAGLYNGASPLGDNISSEPGYLVYDDKNDEDGFGVSKNANSTQGELDVITAGSQEYISIDYSATGASITEANIEFGSVYGNYFAGNNAGGRIEVIALDESGNVVGTFYFDSDESGESGLTIDSNGNATVNIEVDGGFSELRIFTTQDSSDDPNKNSNITLKGVDVVSAELSEEIDYQSVDSSDLVSDEIAQLTIVPNDTDLAPVAQNDTVSVFGGLSGYYYSSNDSVNGNIDSVQDALDVIASKDADLTFDAKDINYTLDGNSSGLSSQSQFEDFLNSDAGSVEGTVGAHTDGVVQMSGSVYLAPGDYAFKVTADDGYTILIDGVAVATVDQNQSSTTTLHDAFTIDSDGYHSIEIVYWDQGGAANLDINLGTVDSNGNYNNGEHDLNDFPLIGDVLSVREGGSLTVDSSLLLANDYDPNTGDTFTIVADGFSSTDGTVSFDQNSGEVSFTPNSSVSGTASFTYTIVDSSGLTNTATVTTMVTPISNGLAVSADLTSVSGNVADSIVTSIESSLTGKVVDSVADGGDNHLQTTSGAWVYGYNGNDTVVYGSGDQMQVLGGEGNDIIVGNGGGLGVVSEDLQGNDGDDILIGGVDASSSIDLRGDGAGDSGQDILISRSPTSSTAYYGGDGADKAYLSGQSSDYIFTTAGASDYTLVHTGTGNANHDFYSIESLYFADGKFEVQSGNLVKVAEVYELNIDIDLNDNDGSEQVSSLVVSDVPADVTLSTGTKQADGTWVIDPTELDSDGKLTVIVEAPVDTAPVLTVTAGAYEVDGQGQPVDSEVFANTQTGIVIAPSLGNENGDNTIVGFDGDDVLFGDTGGVVDNSVAPTNYNIALVVDTSGSMKDALNSNSSESKLDVVKASLIAMLADIASHPGIINLALIGFEASASIEINLQDLEESDLDQTVNSAINALTADGATNYEAAFDAAKDWFESGSQPSSYENLTFFLTDGKPTVSNSSNSSGSTTQFDEFADSVTAFDELADVSKVRTIGIGDGIDSEILEHFVSDNGSSYTYSSTTTQLANFSSSTGEAWSLDNFTVSGGTAVLNNSRILLTDTGNASGSASMTSPEFTVANGEASVLTFDASQGSYFGGGDVFSWSVQKFDEQTQSWVSVSSGSNTGSIETDLLHEGKYQLVLSVYEDQSGYTADVYLDNFAIKTLTSTTGDVEIVQSSQGLDAALEEGSNEITLLPVGNDDLSGGAGNDILFGDAINTDNLPWGEKGLVRPDDLPDGSGMQALTTFLQMLNGEEPTDMEIYEYVKGNHELFNADSDTRGGDDTVAGGLGDDILYGQGGDDTLIGGLGDDILTGGEGEDIFSWVDMDDGSSDTITDFSVADGDKLDLSELLADLETDDINALLNNIEDSITDNGNGGSALTIDKGGESMTIEFNNVTSSELTDYLFNQDGLKYTDS